MCVCVFVQLSGDHPLQNGTILNQDIRLGFFFVQIFIEWKDVIIFSDKDLFLKI